MNRRRFLIALAVVVPIAIFVAAKTAASWRPVPIIIVPGVISGDGEGVAISQNALVIRADSDRRTLLIDPQTGQMRSIGTGGACQDGMSFWRLGPTPKDSRYTPLLISFDGQTRLYPLPRILARRLMVAPQLAKIYLRPDCIELLYEDHYCRWNTHTGRLEGDLKCEMDFESAWGAVTHDGTTIVDARRQPIALLSTRTGRVVNRVMVSSPSFYMAQATSAFGSYVVSNSDDPKTGASISWKVIAPQSGQVLWSCPCASENEFVVLTLDEKCIIVAHDTTHLWEIRDLQTGAILRTLPMVSDASEGALSPDGATLYSVANGVLYRQRAR